MAVDIFMKIDDVKGSASDDKHKGEIDVIGWRFGGSQSGTSQVGSGSGMGKVQINDLEFTKPLCKATPILHSALWQGKHFKQALLTVRQAGGTSPVEYLKITLGEPYVTKIDAGEQGEKHDHVETVHLSFATVKVEYTPQKDDGSADASIVQGWHVAKNVAL